jgi:hypothetical protein
MTKSQPNMSYDNFGMSKFCAIKVSNNLPLKEFTEDTADWANF